MQNIQINLPNQPGELARIADLLAQSKVNILSIATSRREDDLTTLHLVTEDLERAAAVLKKARVNYLLKDVLTITLPDQPGQLAHVARKIAAAGVNIESMYLVDKSSGRRIIALITDDDEAADRAIH